MKLAYLSHNLTLKRIKHCPSEEGKKELALNYFLHDGQAMKEYMVSALYLIEQLEKRIEEMESELNG